VFAQFENLKNVIVIPQPDPSRGMAQCPIHIETMEFNSCLLVLSSDYWTRYILIPKISFTFLNLKIINVIPSLYSVTN